MNKIKVMLTAVVLLSTVGGVLAFKATRSGTICTAAFKVVGGQNTCGAGTAQNPYVNCAGSISPRKISASGVLVCTTDPDPVLDCNQVCPVLTRTTVD